jgi:hypothetical protein
MCGGWAMPAYFFRSEPGAAELRRLARRESGRVCQRVLMIANMLEGMEHEEAARLAGLSRSAAYEWHNRGKGAAAAPGGRQAERRHEGLRRSARRWVVERTFSWFRRSPRGGEKINRSGLRKFIPARRCYRLCGSYSRPSMKKEALAIPAIIVFSLVPVLVCAHLPLVDHDRIH